MKSFEDVFPWSNMVPSSTWSFLLRHQRDLTLNNFQMIPESEQNNFEVFRDCLSTTLIERLAPSTKKKRVKGRKNEIKPVAKVIDGNQDELEAAELSDFTEVCMYG
jgi:hypothetical protein